MWHHVHCSHSLNGAVSVQKAFSKCSVSDHLCGYAHSQTRSRSSMRKVKREVRKFCSFTSTEESVGLLPPTCTWPGFHPSPVGKESRNKEIADNHRQYEEHLRVREAQ